MQVCLCTISYRERLLDVALQAAARVGFKAVELWGREPHVSEEYDESRLKGVRAQFEALGLKLPVLGSYLYFGKTVHKEDTITLVDTLHNAHGLHTPIVRVWASDVPSAKATDEIWEQTVTEAQAACEKATKMGVIFAAEMHDDTLADTGASAKRLVEAVDRPNFRLNYQAASRPGTEDPLARLELVLPYVVHVHCQNFVGLSHDPGYKRVPLNAGYVDYAALVTRLQEAGYDGHLAIEFAAEEGEGKEASLKHDLEFLAGL